MGFPDAQYAIDEIIDELKPTMQSIANVMMSRISIRCLVPGTSFKIEQTDGNDFPTTTKIVAKTDYKDASGVYWIHVPVPPGEYKITISKEDIVTTATVSAKVAGQSYTFTYEVYKLVATLLSGTSYTLEDASDTWPGVYVSALGGGGGGGAGSNGFDWSSGDGSGHAGGGGGRSAGVSVKYLPTRSFTYTLGAGGSGGTAYAPAYGTSSTAGSPGGSTVINNYITIPGGNGGEKGNTSYSYIAANGGSVGGGRGGRGYVRNTSAGTTDYRENGVAGTACALYGAGGAGGAGGVYTDERYQGGAGGGGGAGGYGAGGAGGNSNRYTGDAGANGSYGAGGGGGAGSGREGYSSGAGGAGGSGVILVFKGLVMK